MIDCQAQCGKYNHLWIFIRSEEMCPPLHAEHTWIYTPGQTKNNNCKKWTNVSPIMECHSCHIAALLIIISPQEGMCHMKSISSCFCSTKQWYKYTALWSSSFQEAWDSRSVHMGLSWVRARIMSVSRAAFQCLHQLLEISFYLIL